MGGGLGAVGNSMNAYESRLANSRCIVAKGHLQ
jgi:hypothetical protein